MTNLNHLLKLRFTWLLEKSGRYMYYIDLIVLILVGLWLYVFIRNYYWEMGIGFGEMKNQIDNISYVKLDEAASQAVFEAYQRKMTPATGDAGTVISPF